MTNFITISSSNCILSCNDTVVIHYSSKPYFRTLSHSNASPATAAVTADSSDTNVTSISSQCTAKPSDKSSTKTQSCAALPVIDGAGDGVQTKRRAGKPGSSAPVSHQILATCLSTDARVLAVSDDAKLLTVWRRCESESCDHATLTLPSARDHQVSTDDSSTDDSSICHATANGCASRTNSVQRGLPPEVDVRADVGIEGSGRSQHDEGTAVEELGWRRLNTRLVSRRATVMCFTSDTQFILVADRAGDVFRFPLANSDSSSGELIMGHLSMILDMILFKNDTFLATCDRDEKIRISHYPNTYNIHCFCLGHRKYVSQLLSLSDCLLLSASGDGSLKLWNSTTGKELSSLDCVQYIKEESNYSNPSEKNAKASDKTTCMDQENLSAVKRVVFSSESQLMVVGFEKIEQVLLFKYQLEPSQQNASFSHLTSIPLSAALRDLHIDSSNNLWILQADSASPFLVFSNSGIDWSETTTQSTKSYEENFIKFLNSQEHILKALKLENSVFKMLQKSTVDYHNIEEYLERKKKRLEKQN